MIDMCASNSSSWGDSGFGSPLWITKLVIINYLVYTFISTSLYVRIRYIIIYNLCSLICNYNKDHPSKNMFMYPFTVYNKYITDEVKNKSLDNTLTTLVTVDKYLSSNKFYLHIKSLMYCVVMHFWEFLIIVGMIITIQISKISTYLIKDVIMPQVVKNPVSLMSMFMSRPTIPQIPRHNIIGNPIENNPLLNDSDEDDVSVEETENADIKSHDLTVD